MKHDRGAKQEYKKIIAGLELDDTQKFFLLTSWMDYLFLMNKSARKGWISHNYSQIVVILFSLLIPVIEKSGLNFNVVAQLSLISVFSLIVASLTALNRQLGFEEKWKHYRLTAELIRNEGDDFFALAGNYKKFATHKEAFKTFASIVTSFKRKEVNSYIEQERDKKKDQKTE